MPSPFPGMDPYLEGFLWPDFHHGFTCEIRRELNAQLIPRYVGRLHVPTIRGKNRTYRLASIVLYRTENKDIVTVIEVISPAHKEEPYMDKYLRKRTKLIQSGIHLIEIDLFRDGQRPFQPPERHDSLYLITSISKAWPAAKLWPLTLQQPLPTIPVPLCHPDPDVPLDLAQAFNTLYETAYYQDSIEYNPDPPPPKLPPADLKWWQQHRQPST